MRDVDGWEKEVSEEIVAVVASVQLLLETCESVHEFEEYV